MIYDEERIRSLANLKEFSMLRELYDQLMEMRPLKQKILRNLKCHRCGFCCSKCNAMLSKQDIELLCKYLRCSFEELYEKYLDKNAKMPYLKLPCPFLNQDNGCNVYPARPKVCKEFPFNEFTVIVDPCELGKEIRGIVEEITGPLTEIDKESQELAQQSDQFFDFIINDTIPTDTSQDIDALEDSDRHMRINMDIKFLRKIIAHMKHKKKVKRR